MSAKRTSVVAGHGRRGRAVLTPLVLCTLLFHGVGVRGADRSGSVSWEERRALARAQVEAAIEVELSTAVRRRDIALGLKFEWPLRQPDYTLEEMGKTVDEAVREAVDKRFPPSELRDTHDAIRKELTLWQVGDPVSVVVRGGVGPNAYATGHLREITPQRIRVGNRWVLVSDLSREDQARLFEDMHADMLESKLRQETIRFENARDAWEREHRADLEDRLFRRSGYTKHDGRWVARRDLVEYLYERRRRELAARIRPRIERMIFEEHGFEYDAERRQWLPKRGMLSLGAAIERLMTQPPLPKAEPLPPSPEIEFEENVPRSSGRQ